MTVRENTTLANLKTLVKILFVDRRRERARAPKSKKKRLFHHQTFSSQGITVSPSAAGVPPLAGFWSKLLIVIALWQTSHYGYAVVAILVGIITLAYLLVIQRRVFFGKLPDNLLRLREEAEERLVGLKTSYLTAPLIREFVNAILVEKKLEDK
jgi:NADH:ubiquinone oxidoreductase subunit 2 (subunit N)